MALLGYGVYAYQRAVPEGRLEQTCWRIWSLALHPRQEEIIVLFLADGIFGVECDTMRVLSRGETREEVK